MTTTFVSQPMAWNHERMKFTSNECLSFKALWKMLMLDDTIDSKATTKRKNNFEQIEPAIVNKYTENNMSLLKFFAINALELSAPATPVLLQQQTTRATGWLQLAGHPESIAPAAYGIVRKRISGINDSEAIAYRGISMDFYASKIVPEFIGVTECADGTYLELQDLLHGFKDPAVMDIKMGRRTFLESEVTNAMLRGDLYRKMIAVAPNEPTPEEHQQQAVTKLRYMLFREQMSSSESRGFRIEALRMKGAMPITDLKMVKTDLDVYKTIAQFLCGKQKLIKDLLRRLEEIRRFIEKSVYFQRHEIVGSSIFIVYDEERIGAWIIDFAKARPLPEHMHIDHRRTWIPGNCEEGLLYGIDEFIKIVQDVAADRSTMIAGKHCAKKVFGCPKARQ